MGKPAIYIVSQVERQYTTLILDMDDPSNEEVWQEAPLTTQIDNEGDILNPFDKVEVRSYRLSKINGRTREVPVFGTVSVESFLHQSKLRSPTEAIDYTILSRAEPFKVLAIVQYSKFRPYTLVITAKGLIGGERL